jgi:hypothetical protein
MMTRVGRSGARLAAGAVLLGLAACSGTVQENLGMGKNVPDEFQVVRRAPLTLPPDYSLRPPTPGAPPPAAQDTATQAREILTGQPAPAPDTRQSAGEVALLAQSSVQAAPGIRQTLVAEDSELLNIDASRFLFILNFQRKAMEPKPNVLDPVAEAQRLKAAGTSTGAVVTLRTGSEPLPPAGPIP